MDSSLPVFFSRPQFMAAPVRLALRGLFAPALSIFFSLALLLPASASAQKKTFGAVAMPGPDAVVVLIGRDILHPSTAAATGNWVGYNVYRKGAGDADFRKLNSRPLARVGTLREFEARTGYMADLYATMLKAKDNAAMWALVERNDAKAGMYAQFEPSIREALGLLYRDADVKPGTSYTYAVTRVDRSERESDRSTQVTVIAGRPRAALIGPLAPSVAADDKRVRVSWSPNPADSGAFGYVLYRALDPAGTFTRLNDRPIVALVQRGAKTAPVLEYIDSSVSVGRTYYYTVASRDFAGNESPRGPILSIAPRDTMAPLIPQELRARPSALGILLTWARVASDDLAGYHVYRSTAADGPYARLTADPVPPDTGFYEDREVKPNVQYFYRATAIDASGNESMQSARGLSTYENFKPPMPPQGVAAIPEKGGIRIRWTANEEEDLQGYFVYRAESLNGELSQVSPLIRKDTLFYLDADPHISPKGAYWYLVQAINLTGSLSPFSAPVISSPDAVTGPEPPLSFKGYQDVIGNRLFWTSPVDNAATGMHVYRAVEAASLKWERITRETVPADAHAFTDSAAALGVSYVYRVAAVNDKGLEGSPSHAVLIARFTPPPLPPAGISVLPSALGMRVGWNLSLEPAVSGYNVWRKVGKEAWRKLNGQPLSATARFFDDTTPPKNAVAMYSVTCVGNDGRESERGEPMMLRLK